MIFGKRKKTRNPNLLVYERWQTAFKRFQRKRFVEEETDSYGASVEKHAFVLTLKRENLFAWVLEGNYKYRDFYIEADIAFDEINGHSAAGFVFRYVNKENFYYFMLSNRSMFRFDVVFNGNPIHLIEWTKNPLISERENKLRIIADGSYFSFYIGDEWIAEMHDEMVYQGHIGFAGQNYHEKPEAKFYLRQYAVDSRPVQVEKMYYRWARYVPANPEFRIELAGTLASMSGSTLLYLEAAAVQMKKALALKRDRPEDFVFYSQILIRLKLYSDALKAAENALEINPDLDDALIAKANILYFQNRFIEARDFIEKIVNNFKDNAMLMNLLGNVQYSLGNWEEALNAYIKACKVKPGNTLFAVNEARCLEVMGKKLEAVERYRDVSIELLKREQYDELSEVLERIKRIDPESDAAEELEGKVMFFEGREKEAESILKRRIKNSTGDSTIYYLFGMIQAKKSARDEAVKYFKKAVKLEPDFAPYRFKLAEAEFLNGENPVAELEKAYKLEPENPWINNLYGLYFMEKGDTENAERYLETAYNRAPEEVEILLNYTKLLVKKGYPDRASALLNEKLAHGGDDPRLHNELGNILVSVHDYEKAVLEYKKALNQDGENPVYLENYVSLCIKNGMLSDAEKQAVKLLDIADSPEAYCFIGRIALSKGEYIRAETAFLEGLERNNNYIPLKLGLAENYLNRMNIEKAYSLTGEVLRQNPGNVGALILLRRIEKNYMNEISCAACGRKWHVPKNIGPQPVIRIIGEVPDEAPAGRCPNCGKVYCVGCASRYIKNKRFTCPDCGDYLKLSDNSLRYLLKGYLTKDTD